jgi:hypothetical protein
VEGKDIVVLVGHDDRNVLRDLRIVVSFAQTTDSRLDKVEAGKSLVEIVGHCEIFVLFKQT